MENQRLKLYGCSDTSTAVEMVESLVPELYALAENGIEAYDVMLKQMVIVVCPVMCIIADNPRATELLNHLGGSARQYYHKLHRYSNRKSNSNTVFSVNVPFRLVHYSTVRFVADTYSISNITVLIMCS